MPIPYSVTISASLFGDLLRWFSVARPKEAYLFLGGKILTAAEHCYQITHIYMPQPQRVGLEWYRWTDEDRHAATTWAAKRNAGLLGIAHSHVYGNDHIPYYGITQSYHDAQAQISYHFPLSLVVAFFGESTGAAWWLSGYAAPLEAQIKQGRKTIRLDNWLEQNH